jgi:perosamine synthetase
MLRYVSPAAAPLQLGQVLRAMGSVFDPRGDSDPTLSSVANSLSVRYVFGTCSGRSGLWLILKSLHRLRPDRNVVALPAYTCYSVPASVVRAGLTLFPVDIDPETLDFDPVQLENVPRERLLCILSGNLFGFVNDMDTIEAVGRVAGAFVVDNSAQALGASLNGRAAGTLGDVGLYSLGRGKALTTGEGGIIVTNSEEVARSIQTEVGGVPPATRVDSAWLFAKLVVYSIFLNPRWYWIPNSLPFLKLGITEYRPDFRVALLSSLSRSLLPELMKGLAEVTRIRRENAALLTKALSRDVHYLLPQAHPGCAPNYLRFPVLTKTASHRDEAVRRLRRAGIGASPFYPGAICDIPGLDRHMAVRDAHRPKAESIARRLFTLPTHALVGVADLQRAIGILEDLSQSQCVRDDGGHQTEQARVAELGYAR